jgi:hypothetical protein
VCVLCVYKISAYRLVCEYSTGLIYFDRRFVNILLHKTKKKLP